MTEWSKLRQIREVQGLSREALSKKSGVAATQIYRMETGRRDYRNAALDTIQALADALGTTVDELTNDRDPVDSFIDGLEKLDTCKLRALRKEAGKPMGDASASAYLPFYSILPHNVEDDDVVEWFDAACIAAYCITSEKEGKPVELATALGSIDAEADTDMMMKRIANAIDTSWDADGFAAQLVYKLVRVAVQHSYNVDYRMLTRDILSWNDPHQDVGWCWADAYNTARRQ